MLFLSLTFTRVAGIVSNIHISSEAPNLAQVSVDLVYAGRFVGNTLNSQAPQPLSSLSEWLILDHLSQQNQPVPFTTFRGLIGKRPAITEMIQGLCINGYTHVMMNPSDGRSKLVEITALGSRILEITQPEIHGVAASLLEKLDTDEVNQLGYLAHKFLDSNDQLLWTPAPIK